tara:strand:+ start:891 stop:1757 length:867 start_codon:yes stop_codon:yes gene_type:complete
MPIPLYLPEHKKKKGKLLGKLLDLLTGAAFLGSFFQNHLGQFFKGKGMTANPEPLLFIPDKKEEETDTKFFNRYLKPSDKDYEKGKLTRYFVKDIPSGKVAELDKNAYVKQQKEDKPYRKFHKLDWLVSGLVENTKIKGYDAEGIKSKNEKTILLAERALPGIKNLLTDGTQFTKNTLTQNVQGNLVSEEDRLGANSKENLETKIGQFVLKGTDIPYNGPYHIHPTLGPMAGARHTKAIHPQLDYVGTNEGTPTELAQQQTYQETQSTTVSQPTTQGGTLRRSSYSSY